MQIAALRALEFDRIVSVVRGLALTPMGEERLARLQPSSDATKVAQLLAATSETAQFLVKNGSLPLRASKDLPAILGSLAIEGRALEALRLLALSTFLESIDETRAAIRHKRDSPWKASWRRVSRISASAIGRASCRERV